VTLQPEPVPVIDVDLVAVAVLACPLVAGLHGGTFGEVATYLPGRRVTGIRTTPTGLEIHVIARFPATAARLADQIRAAVAPWAGGLPVDVVLEDVLLPGELLPGEEPDPAPRPPAQAPVDASPTATAVVVESDSATVSVEVPADDPAAPTVIRVDRTAPEPDSEEPPS
jgi:hypothetical protein